MRTFNWKVRGHLCCLGEVRRPELDGVFQVWLAALFYTEMIVLLNVNVVIMKPNFLSASIAASMRRCKNLSFDVILTTRLLSH